MIHLQQTTVHSPEHAKTILKDDFQSVALCEFNGVRIYIDSHEKRSHII